MKSMKEEIERQDSDDNYNGDDFNDDSNQVNDDDNNHDDDDDDDVDIRGAFDALMRPTTAASSASAVFQFYKLVGKTFRPDFSTELLARAHEVI